MQCNATPAQHWRAMDAHSKDQLLRSCGIPDLERRTMRRLWRYRSWLEVTNQFQENTVGVDCMDDTPGIGVSTRATRCDLREKRHILSFKNRHSPLNVGHREGKAIDALVINWRRIGGLRIKRRYPLE